MEDIKTAVKGSLGGGGGRRRRMIIRGGRGRCGSRSRIGDNRGSGRRRRRMIEGRGSSRRSGRCSSRRLRLLWCWWWWGAQKRRVGVAEEHEDVPNAELGREWNRVVEQREIPSSAVCCRGNTQVYL